MKKVIFMLAAVAMAMSACTSTEVIEEGLQSNAIGFASHVNKASRAIDATADLTQFQVYGSYKLAAESNRVINFNDVLVQKNGADWSYGTDKRYWIKDASYRFYAYSDDNAAVHSGTADFGSATGILNINNYVADENNQHDLVFAKSAEIQGKETGNDKVPFTFKHALARLMVTIKSGFPAGYDMKVSDVKIMGMYNTGSYRAESFAAEHEWTASTETTGQVVPSLSDKNTATAANGTTAAVDVETGFAYVIPNNYAGKSIVSIQFRIDVTNPNGEAVVGRTLKANWAPNWVAGRSYNYNVTVNGSAAGLEPIEFTVTTVDGWGDGKPTLPDFNLGASFVENND